MTVLQFPAAASRPALARLLAITARAWRLSTAETLGRRIIPALPQSLGPPMSRVFFTPQATP